MMAIRKKKGWISIGEEEKKEFIKRELAKYEAFDKKAEQSLRVSERSLNRVIKI